MTPRKGEGLSPLVSAYHHLIAVIKAAIATIALIIKSTTSNAVGFFFCCFIFSPPLLSILYHTASSMSIPFFNIFCIFTKMSKLNRPNRVKVGAVNYCLFLKANQQKRKEHRLLSSVHNQLRNAYRFQFLKCCPAQ